MHKYDLRLNFGCCAIGIILSNSSSRGSDMSLPLHNTSNFGDFGTSCNCVNFIYGCEFDGHIKIVDLTCVCDAK